MRWMLFVLIFSITLLQAQDQEYIQIYNSIINADALKDSGESRIAADRYREAQNALKKLQSVYPKWNEQLVKFRLEYIAEKLQSLGTVSPATNRLPVSTPVPGAKIIPQSGAKIISQPDTASEQVRQLRSEKALLEAKLKEALSVQPNPRSASDVSKLEEKIVSLQKERDLLSLALEQEKTIAGQTAEAKDRLSKKLQELQRTKGAEQKRPATADQTQEVAQLRARLAALEARPEPFTPEELALLKQPEPQLASTESKPAKKSKELPAGAGALVAQAERAFAARRFDEAEKKYLEVLRQDEKNVYLLGNLAATQLEMDHVADVEKNLGRALAIDPQDAFCLTLSGMVKFREGKFDEALDVLSRAATIDPQNPETQNYLGITLSQKGQRAAAEAALRKAIKIQPAYPGAHHNLAVIYATQKPPFLELARWHYEKALALGHPKNSELEKLMAEGK